MTFERKLAEIESSRLAIVTSERDVSFAALIDEAAALVPAMPGQRLVLNHPDLVQSLAVLIAADGRADSVALMSPKHDPALLAPLMTVLEPDQVISQQGDALRDAGLAVPVQQQAGELPASQADPIADTAWVITTSGTTDVPKLVQHSLASLTRTARLNTTRGRDQVWGLIYDYTRFAGFQVVLQSLLSGACLALPAPDMTLDEQLRFMGARGVTHLSATPTMWRKILMSPHHRALNLRQITLGGEIVDDAVLNSVARAWPEARVSHIFASTEAGVGFSVSDRKSGFPASYLTDPPSGIDLRLQEGRLWVRNERVGAHYLGGQGAVVQDGWIDTGDMVAQEGGRVHFKGRESGVINVGGNKVHPEEVERALLAYPNVSMARVYSKANPIMGAVVMADVMPGPDAPDTFKQDLAIFLRTRLEKHKVPASIRLGDGFEMNAAGKIRRDG